MKRNITITLVAVLALLALAVVAIPAIPVHVAAAAVQAPTNGSSAPVVALPKFATLGDLEGAFENIYAQVSPSVVAIDIVQSSSAAGPGIPTLPNGHPVVPQGPGGLRALGSGFVWDNQGNIVTNNHVVDGATSISVTFADGTIVTGKVIGADPNSDLAVVKVDAPAALLHPVQVADSKLVKVGQLTVAIGNPYGEQNTMTTGIVSAVGRSLPVHDLATLQGPSYSIPDVIQTDAPINPGNSGGVLLNSQGQVIGVTQSIESASGSSAGIGFAIPSAIVQKVVPALIKTGHYDHPYIGIGGATLTPDLAQAMGLAPTQRGAVVATVTTGGPAEKAGLRGGTAGRIQAPVGADIVTAIDGQAVKSFDDIVAYLANSTQVNQTVTLTLLRDGKEQTIKVTLGARPSTSG